MDSDLPIGCKQQQLVEEFLGLDDWTARYEYIMQMGECLLPYPQAWRQAAHRVHGCASLLWLRGEGDASCLLFRGASDCPMDAGLLAIALHVYSGQPGEEIVASPPRFISAMGLPSRFSINRLEGLEKVVVWMRRFALDRLLDARLPIRMTYACRQRRAG